MTNIGKIIIFHPNSPPYAIKFVCLEQNNRHFDQSDEQPDTPFRHLPADSKAAIWIIKLMLVLLHKFSHLTAIIMDQDLKKQLSQDQDGLLTYEYIANHIGHCDEIMGELVDNMILVDSTGQFVVSAARYLYAIDNERYSAPISHLIAAAIEKDRERRYLPDLITTIWGADYQSRAAELSAADDNFRRIYKRITPTGSI